MHVGQSHSDISAHGQAHALEFVLGAGTTASVLATIPKTNGRCRACRPTRTQYGERVNPCACCNDTDVSNGIVGGITDDVDRM